MADNVILNAGSGGATMRTVSDSSGDEWIPAVLCYAITTTPGAATFQFVNASNGVPVTVLGTVPVSGTFWQTTQPVSIASAVGVTQSGAWSVTVVDSVNLNVAVAAALPAGTNSIGTVQPGNTPNTTPWLANQADPAVTTGSITTVDLVISTATGQSGQSILTGTPTAGSSVTVALSGETCVNLQVAGTWTGTLVFERSIDGGTTYYPAAMLMHGNGGLSLSSITGNCGLRVNAGGSTNFRVRATATVTGTALITFRPGFGDGVIGASLETGGNVIGEVCGGPSIALVFNGTAPVAVQTASFSTSSASAVTIIAAVSGKKIYVLRWSVSANGTTNVNLQSHTTINSTTSTGVRYLTQFASGGGSWCPGAIMATAAGEALDVNNTNAIAVSGEVTYVQF